MRRNGHTTTAHPDTEQAAAELASIVGEKHTVQTEVLSLAQNKKELTETFETEKARMEEELETARKELAQFLYDSEQKHRNIQSAIIVAEAIRDEVIAGNKKLEERKQVFEPEIIALETRKATLIIDVGELETSFSDLQKLITKDEDALAVLNKKKDAAQKDITTLEQQKTDKEKEHSSLSVKVGAHADSVDGLLGVKQQLETDITGIEKSISAKKENLEILRLEEIKVQTKIQEHKDSIAKEDTRINDRLGVLAHAENRAGQQLELLKEAKSHFTSEQLLRVGIRE